MESTSAVVDAPESVSVRSFDVPSVGDGDAILEIELGGVCGSDPKAYRGELYADKLPAILGHEILGRIHSISSSAREEFNVEEGNRVVVEGRRRCGTCSHCVRGRYQFCENGGVYGYRPVTDPPGLWGAHGEYMYLQNGTMVYPISDDIPAEAAVLAVAVVGNSIRWLQAGAENVVGKSAVIQGPGPQGLAMTIVANKAGVSPIIVTGVPGDERRLELACELGADFTVCAEPEELVERTREILGGNAEIVVNLTGHPDSAQQSIELVDIEGTIVYPSVSGKQSTVQFDTLVEKGASLRGILSRTAPDVHSSIALIEQDPKPFAKLISHKFAVEDAEQAYRTAGGMEAEMPLKVAIDPSL